MTTEDSMSDDVFEAEDAVGVSTSVSSLSASTTGGLNVLSNQSNRTPSPTGYKDYRPPAELFDAPKPQVEEVPHKTILLGDSGVGKTSLLVHFDTGKFKGGSFAATVGIGFMEKDLYKAFLDSHKSSVFHRNFTTRKGDSEPQPGWKASDSGPKREKKGKSSPHRKRQTSRRNSFSRSHWSKGSFQSNGACGTKVIDDNPGLRKPFESSEPGCLVAKVMLLGDSGVGKTCLLVRFRDGHFLSGNFISTVGIDFRNKVVTVDDTKVKLQIWDTAGQERFRSVTHAYYRDAHALLLLYDVTNKTSFDNTRAWLGEIKDYAQEDVVIMLLGNKADCGSDRTVRKEDGERLASEYNVAFMETSAKTGLNVELAFMAIAKELKSRKMKRPDETAFNVKEYIRDQSRRTSCPPCNT